jgi:hypothetical protein
LFEQLEGQMCIVESSQDDERHVWRGTAQRLKCVLTAGIGQRKIDHRHVDFAVLQVLDRRGQPLRVLHVQMAAVSSRESVLDQFGIGHVVFDQQHGAGAVGGRGSRPELCIVTHVCV